jgi:hypothetical protein
MSASFQEVLDRRTELLHRQAIWQEVVDHLRKFLDTDAVKATVGIKTEGPGLVVPQDRIEGEIAEISNGYMAEINDELTKIDKSEVAEHVEQKKQGAKKKAGRKPQGSAKGKGRAKAPSRSKKATRKRRPA